MFGKMVNIGQIIKEDLDRQNLSAGWLARELGCNRSTMYRMIDRNSIDTAMLARISIALGIDFFKVLSDEMNLGGKH